MFDGSMSISYDFHKLTPPDWGWTQYSKEELVMQSYVCELCDYTYDPAKGDPENGVQPGTAFEQLPDEWKCPVCGADKDEFQAVPDTA